MNLCLLIFLGLSEVYSYSLPFWCEWKGLHPLVQDVVGVSVPMGEGEQIFAEWGNGRVVLPDKLVVHIEYCSATECGLEVVI